jgi:hypothetical protein
MGVLLRKTVSIFLSTVVVAAVAVASASAAPWAEVGDAGHLPGTAQTPNGSGALTTITGAVGGGDADVYRICLTGEGTFSADTSGSALPDTQLFLFDSDGMGVEANDDGGDGLKAVLPAGGLSPAAGGVYYLAVSAYNNDPVSPAGLIFPSFPFAPVYGPTEAGGGQAISGWNAFSSYPHSAYTIALTGARFCRQEGGAIDIKPGSATNPINLGSKGVIPVALLTTPDFDATTLDVATADFEGAEDAHGVGHAEDVDGDGDVDLVLHFRTQETAIAAGDTDACLNGTTVYGESVMECDSISLVP